jgi:O-antigen/teichoic acid export membrane protein
VLALMTVHVFRRVPLRFDLRLFRKQAGYTIPLSVGSIGEFILNYGDRYFLRQAVSLSDIGIYSLAYKIGMVIPMIQYPFQLYWGSQEVKIVREPGGWRVFSRVGTYFTAGLTFSLVLIVLFVHPLLHFMVGPAFRSAAMYAPWIAFAYLLRAVFGYFREIFVIEARPRLDAWVTWVGAALCLGGYWVLIPRYKVWGAVMATVGSFIVTFFYSYYSARKVRRVDYEFDRFAKIALSTAVSLGIYAAIRPDTFWTQAALGVVLSAVFLLILHLTHFLRPEEREILAQKVRMIWAPGALTRSSSSESGAD